MSDQRFEYDDDLLSACARSELAVIVGADRNDSPEVAQWDTACTWLHHQYALHYNRSLQHSRGLGTDTSSNRKRSLDGRFRRFIKSVLQVHAHNSNPQKLYRLSLNQFADLEYPVRETGAFDIHAALWDAPDKELVFLIAEPQDVMDIAANLTIGKGGLGHLNPPKGGRKKPKNQVREQPAERVKFDGSDPNFSVPSIDDPTVDGDLLKITPRNKLEGEITSGQLDGDRYSTYLNWATTDNPDGVRIVRDAFDQVSECNLLIMYADNVLLECVQGVVSFR
jgi:Cathepsin propeptide inhibitor domain (I29)